MSGKTASFGNFPSSRKTILQASLRVMLVFAILLAVIVSLINFLPARAATTLTVEPITWNVIGLDSNNVNVGPNNFPVGVRVCNTGTSAATNVTADFVWDSTNTYINIRPGTENELSVPSLAIGACTDFYFEVQITRDANAYDTKRSYHIEVTETGTPGTTWSTPTPRELYVEYLISQSRNATATMELSTTGLTGSYTDIPVNGTMTLMVGQTYWIKLTGFTATNGYEQIETFINMPNTIFQVLEVDTTYTADSSSNVDNPSDLLYGDSCVWVDNPLSPNYRSCVSTGKNGGDITVTYKVKILSVPSAPMLNPEAMRALTYDFSGSSYHYNADFYGSVRYANIVNAGIVKSFSPKSINANSIPTGTSTLTFTINNPGPDAISSANFTDTLPAGVSPTGGQMSVASTGVTYTGCGTPSPASLTLGQTALSFSNITVNGLSTCTIAITVTANADGTYNNTSGHLYIGTNDTGSYATDTLVATSKPAGPATCATPVTLATWTMPTTGQGSGGPPPPYTTRALDVSSTTASSSGGSPSISTTGNPANAWMISGGWETIGLLPNSASAPYFQFSLDTSNYGGVAMSFEVYIGDPGDWQSGGGNNQAWVYSQADSGSFSAGTSTTLAKAKWEPVTYSAPSTGVSQTTFRINLAGGANANAYARIDNVTITGCPRPLLPTLTKSFSPASIATDSQYSTLTFTFTNPNTTSLSGVGFSDTLPTGLVVNDPNGTPTVSCTTGSSSGQNITAVAGSTSISLSGATLAANSSCSFLVRVKGTVAADYQNVSGNITSTETGVNTTSTGYGTSDLEVVDPPVIAKDFGSSYIITNNPTTLTFKITNPNSNATLSNVSFTDSTGWPAGLVVATPNGLTGDCDDAPFSGTITAVAGSSSVSLSSMSMPAGSSCTLTVDVLGTTTGVKVNTTGNVSHVINGSTVNGNTATANLLVRDLMPGISLKKQVGTTDTGPWYDSVIIPAGSTVYYKFTIENIGDVVLSPVSVNDPMVSTAGCAWPVSLPVAVAANDNHIASCIVNVVTPITAAAGYTTNTATAQGTYNSTIYYSNPDSASYLNGNFGHLPSAYQNMNLFDDGGAMNINGSTYLGTRLPGLGSDPGEMDGINTPAYTTQVTDDGVNWTGTWSTGVGSASVVATCSTGTERTLYGWFDWNNDGDFIDTVDGAPEAQSWTVACDADGAATTPPITINFPGTGNLAAGTYYVRFRIYDTVPTAGASALGASTLAGEIEDYFITSDGGGGTPTPVTVSYFKSEEQGGQVQFSWFTATETGNLGFNLYAVIGGDLTRINEELIPSSVIDSLDQQQYSYSAQTDGTLFYIEDVDLRGETRRHGPFALGEEYGSASESEQINWAAVQSDLDSATVTGLELSKDSGLVNALNLQVRQTGLYRLTYEMLRNAGLDLNGARPANISITSSGRAVPVYVQSTQGRFGPGNYIEFHGKALDTPYTDTNVYTIQLSQTRSPLIAVDNTALSNGVRPVVTYLETVLVNNQRMYSSSAPGSDPWYDNYVFAQKSSATRDFVFEIHDLANPAVASSLHLVVWGMVDFPQNPDHHMLVNVNGVPVADQWFDGIAEKIVKVTIPGGVLQEGSNTLTLTLPADTGGMGDLVYLDKFSVTYRRMLYTQDGHLTFTAAGSAFRVKNLSTPNVVVYRLEKNRPVRVGKVTVRANGSTYTATFPGSTTKYTYIVSAVESLYTPALSNLRVPANLERRARYLIISHPAFMDGIQPLVVARKAQGLTVNVVDVNDLYAKYTHGVYDPKAIKDYIRYARQNLGTQYVLLVGGDTYDYRNFLGKNSISFIPSLYIATSSKVRFVPSDPLYADVDGDKVPDLAIGRFPVRTAAELELMVNKTLAYQDKDYGRTGVFASDKMDGGIFFKGISTSMSGTLPSNWSVENIHLDNLSVSAAQAQLLAAMNRGTALVTYTGHSGPTKWTLSGLFNTKNAAALTNAGRPFVAVQWGCWNNYYVDPVNNSLVQSFLFSGDRGAAATLGALTLVDSQSEALLGRLLMPRLVSPGMTIGQAVLDAKQELAITHADLLDILLGWTLMGDPALIIEP